MKHVRGSLAFRDRQGRRHHVISVSKGDETPTHLKGISRVLLNYSLTTPTAPLFPQENASLARKRAKKKVQVATPPSRSRTKQLWRHRFSKRLLWRTILFPAKDEFNSVVKGGRGWRPNVASLIKLHWANVDKIRRKCFEIRDVTLAFGRPCLGAKFKNETLTFVF